MTTKTDPEKLFDQAADTFLNAFKTCVRLQEDTTKKCFELAKGWGEGADWTKQYQELSEQAVPNMQKAAAESLEFWEKNATKCLDLLGEGFAAAQPAAAGDAQAKLQKLWEESLETMRKNTETMVNLSSEAMQAYADFMKSQKESMASPAAAGK